LPYLFLLSRVSPLSIAFSLQYDDLRVVDEPVGDRCGDSGTVEDVSPLRKRQIGSDQGGFQFVPLTDDLEEQVRALLAQRKVTDFVDLC
jgi:hypothetical protein